MLIYSVYAQDFQEEIADKSLVISNLTNINNLQFEIKTPKSRTSVWIEILKKDGKIETKKIYNDSIFSIPTQETEKVTIVHKRRFIFRVKNKIDFDPPKPKDKRKGILNRTRITSTGGSATSTAVVAT